MEQERAYGIDAVASLLRRLADDIQAGELPLHGRRVPCGQDLNAVIGYPSGEEAPLLVVSVAIGVERDHLRPLAVEQELSRPGG